MRLSAFCTLTLAAALAIAPSAAAQETPTLPARLHPWGLFNPGAWKTVHVVTETLNEQGLVCGTTTTDAKTILIDIDNGGVTLEIQACMEVAGKRFEADPQIVKQGFHGELAGPDVTLKPPTDGQLVIDGQKIPCKVQQIETAAQGGKTITTLYYSTSLPPYVLKRESVVADPEGKIALSEVVGLNAPLKVRGETRNGVKMKTVSRGANGTVTTWADILCDVPGGVVCNNTKEVDKHGRLVRRSTLDLIDYNTDPEKDRTGLFGRKRPPRHRAKSTPRFEP